MYSSPWGMPEYLGNSIGSVNWEAVGSFAKSGSKVARAALDAKAAEANKQAAEAARATEELQLAREAADDRPMWPWVVGGIGLLVVFGGSVAILSKPKKRKNRRRRNKRRGRR